MKAANEALVESMVRQLRDCVSVGDEMTLDHASLIDDAADWIAGEPGRLAAAQTEGAERAWEEAVKATELEQAHVRLRAVAAAREEQREADLDAARRAVAGACSVCQANVALTVDSTLGGIAPLKTPLADRIKKLEAAHVESQMSGAKEAIARKEAEARVQELEAERDELRLRIHDACPSPDEGGRIHAGSRIVCGQCHDSEVRHLTNERDEARAQVRILIGIREDRDEAVAALREYENDPCISEAARAVLAKYEEGT